MKGQHRRLSIINTMVLFWAQVWKRIVALSPFFWAFPFFIWPFFFWPFFAFLFFSFLLFGDNALIIMIITLLFFYNSWIKKSKLEQDMTLYECLRRCTGMGNESRVTCMINYAWWLSHKYDVNYMIMQGNITMMKRVINEKVESCMAIYLGMAMEMP